MQLAGRDENGLLIKVFYCGFALIIALNFAIAVYWLGAESLWIDELFTAYFADASQPSASAVITRTLEDVHPPGYYLLTWAITGLTEIEFTTIVRVQSVFFGVLTLLVMYWSFPPGIKIYSRLFSLAAAVTSISWLQYAMEARSYTLVFLISALFVLLGLRIIERLLKQETPVLLLVSLVALGIIGSLVHYYLLLLAGSAVGMLLLLSVNWRQRFSLVAVGLAILVPIAIFIKWHSGFIVIDVTDTWFSMDYQFIKFSISSGFSGVFGSVAQRILIVGTVLASIAVYLKSANGEQPGNQITRTYLFIIGCCLAPILLGLAVSFLSNPMFSPRLFLISMPFYWVLIGLVSNALMERLPKSTAVFVVALSLLIFFSVSISRILDQEKLVNENWRDSAAYIDGFDQCKGEIVPVVGFGQPVVSVGDINITYAYYLNNRGKSEFLEISLKSNYQDLAQSGFHQLVGARIANRNKCPVLVWTVHHWLKPKLEAFVNDIREEFSLPEGRSIKVKKFAGDAFVVTIE